MVRSSKAQSFYSERRLQSIDERIERLPLPELLSSLCERALCFRCALRGCIRHICSDDDRLCGTLLTESGVCCNEVARDDDYVWKRYCSKCRVCKRCARIYAKSILS